MTKFLKVVFLIVAVLWFEVYGIPLFQGISFQRGFEINFKPLPRNPITFLKEKWSPFGVFGRKHSIQKRSTDSVQASPVIPLAAEAPEPRSAAPVFEHVEEIEHFQTSPLLTLPNQTPRSVIPLLISSPVAPPVSPIPPPQVISSVPTLVSSPAPPPMPLNVIVTPVPHPALAAGNIPPPFISPVMVNSPPNQQVIDAPFNPPVPVRPISSNMVVPPRPATGLFTDISRAEPVREYMNSIQPVAPPLAVEEKAAPPFETNSIKPEVPRNDIVINDNSLVRGSKLALYFGSIFLQLMSQFMSNARATFDQMSNPPPIYNN